MKIFPALASLTLALLIWPSEARSCSCVFTWDDETFQKAAVVFLGEVRKVEKVNPDDCANERVTFGVLESWKGIPKARQMVDVVTSTTGRLADGSRAEEPDKQICVGGCGAAVDEAELYVVFAYEQREKDGATHLAFDCADIVRSDDPEYPELVSKLEGVGTRRR